MLEPIAHSGALPVASIIRPSYCFLVQPLFSGLDGPIEGLFKGAKQTPDVICEIPCGRPHSRGHNVEHMRKQNDGLVEGQSVGFHHQ